MAITGAQTDLRLPGDIAHGIGQPFSIGPGSLDERPACLSSARSAPATLVLTCAKGRATGLEAVSLHQDESSPSRLIVPEHRARVRELQKTPNGLFVDIESGRAQSISEAPIFRQKPLSKVWLQSAPFKGMG